MERMAKVAKVAALGMLSIFLAIATLCLWSAYQTLELVHWKLATIDTAKVNDVTTTLKQKIVVLDVVKLNGAIAKANNTLRHMDQAIVLIKQQFDQLDPRTLNTIALHIDKTVGHIDQASHDEVAQQRAVSERTLAVLNDTDLAVKQVQLVMEQLLQDLVEAKATLVQSTGTMANINHTTAQLDRKVTEMLKPASFLKRVLVGLSSAGAQSLNWWRALE